MSNFVDNANATALMGAVEESIANTRIFPGTLDEYDALTPEEKAKYKYIATPDQEVVTKNNLEAEIADIVNVYGAKNLIPYPYNHTTRTVNGITFTDNGDGTVTASGTATDTAVFQLLPYHVETDNVNPKIPTNGDSVLLSGCPSGGKVGNTTYFYIQLSESVGSAVWSKSVSDYGEGARLTPLQNPMSIYVLRIVINSGTVISTPITFKPMLRLASIQDDTWVPYAKTNKELTDNLKVKTIELTNQASTSDGKLILTGMGHKMAIVSSRLLDDSNNHLIVPFGFCYSSNGDALFALVDNSTNAIITSSITLSGTMEYIDLS